MIPKSNYTWASIAFVLTGCVMSFYGGAFYGGKGHYTVGWVSGWAGMVGNLAWLFAGVGLYFLGVYEREEDQESSRSKKIGCAFLALAVVPIIIALTWGMRHK